MLDHRLDRQQSILYLRPRAALQEEDFRQLSRTVDPYIEEAGDLAGIVVEFDAFPGWDSLGAMAAHFRFVKDHHRRIRKVAVVTDAALGNVAENLAARFVAAEIRRFKPGEAEAARSWIAGPSAA